MDTTKLVPAMLSAASFVHLACAPSAALYILDE
jgi:hypothetical protein